MLRFSPNSNLAHLIHWHEWENGAFRAAREQNKPVMLFLSAFWCRYCQRMDEDALSDRENMALLNAYFVALRVEDAKRPDIDARYNLNGWPTIAFFTPAGELLAASNYLAAEEFKTLLLNVYIGYREKQLEPRLSVAPSTEPARPGKRHADAEIIGAITSAIMAQADIVHGGFGQGQKFLYPDATEFLLARYGADREPTCLEHACRTLDGMGAGQIHDTAEGGYFRTTTKADWSQPHREKLLKEEAGLLSNCLGALHLTGRSDYAHMAEEIIRYLDNKLFDARLGAFFGCEDYLRRENTGDASKEEFFTVIDECIYSDANARAVGAYLDAATLLGRSDCAERALAVIEFLWSRCRSPIQGMVHYYDGAPWLPGLLEDQVQMGIALVRAFGATAEAKYVERACELAHVIVTRLRNPAGGYFDSVVNESVFCQVRLTDVEQNGAAAALFVRLFKVTGNSEYLECARWALDAFSEEVIAQGIHASRFGRALVEYLSPSIINPTSSQP